MNFYPLNTSKLTLILISYLRRTSILAVLLFAASAFAQRAGDDVVFGGLVYLDNNSKITNASNSNSVYDVTSAGLSSTVHNVFTLVGSDLHMFTDNLAAELVLGAPPTIKTSMYTPANVVNHAIYINQAITSKAESPSLIAKYLYGTPADKVRPYLGLGVNYTHFSNLTYDPQIKLLASNGLAASPSWNPVFNTGLSYKPDPQWILSAILTDIPLSTHTTMNGNAGIGPNSATSHLIIDPIILGMSLGYKF